MSITIAELINLALNQQSVTDSIQLDAELVRKYAILSMSLPELTSIRVSRFTEFLERYDYILHAIAPHLNGSEYHVLAANKDIICSVVFSVFERIV